MDRLGPDNFSTLQMKRHVLHRVRGHLKVPGWSFVWNALLTKKLPMFLSRLNGISGGCERFYQYQDHSEVIYIRSQQYIDVRFSLQLYQKEIRRQTKLLFTETDSLTYEIKTEDVYKDSRLTEINSITAITLKIVNSMTKQIRSLVNSKMKQVMDTHNGIWKLCIRITWNLNGSLYGKVLLKISVKSFTIVNSKSDVFINSKNNNNRHWMTHFLEKVSVVWHHRLPVFLRLSSGLSKNVTLC